LSPRASASSTWGSSRLNLDHSHRKDIPLLMGAVSRAGFVGNTAGCRPLRKNAASRACPFAVWPGTRCPLPDLKWCRAIVDRFDAGDCELLFAGEPERVGGVPIGVLQRQHAHADDVRPVDPLVGFGDNRSHPEQCCALGTRSAVLGTVGIACPAAGSQAGDGPGGAPSTSSSMGTASDRPTQLTDRSTDPNRQTRVHGHKRAAD
jgi:hypothetical protein